MFSPGSIDYAGALSRNFIAGRGLSVDAQATWRSVLAPHLDGAARILDVGSGAGRFSALFASWFRAFVVGLEPAAAMRDAARAMATSHVAYLGGRAEQLPFRTATFDAAFLSNVFHHLREPSSFAMEIYRVLGPGAVLLLRSAFPDRLGEITMFEHFPEARKIFDQFPHFKQAVATFEGAGFVCESVSQVSQHTASSLMELADRTRLRADTTLVLVTDEAFIARQRALEELAAIDQTPKAVIDTLDLVVLRKTA